MKLLNVLGFVMCTVSLFAAVDSGDWLAAALLGVFSLGNFLCVVGIEQ